MNVFDSFDFRDLFRAGILRYTDEGDKDDNMIYLHILDCIGALSSIQKRRENIHLKTKKQNTNDQVAESNRRIFWQVVRELADKELPLADRKVSTSSEINWAQYRVLDVFPDEAKRLDGRSWLPLHWAMSLPITDIQDIENLIIAKPERLNILTTEFGLNPIHLACLTNGRVDVVHLLMDHLPLDERSVKYASVQIFQMIAEENMVNLTVMTDEPISLRRSASVAHIAVQFQKLDILRYIQSVKPEVLLSKDSADELPISYLTFLALGNLSSLMSIPSEILRFLLHHCRSKVVDSDPFGYSYRAFYRILTNAEEDEEDCLGLDLQYPRRLLLLAGHPSLCLPEVLRDLNYSARRGALFLFFHHHLPNPPLAPPPPASLSLSSTHTATGATIFWRIRDGPGSKELIRAIIGFL
eukprot:gene31125-40476_t